MSLLVLITWIWVHFILKATKIALIHCLIFLFLCCSPSQYLLQQRGSGFIAFLLMEEMEVEENLGPCASCLGCVGLAGLTLTWWSGKREVFWMMYIRGWEMQYLKRGAWAPARSAGIAGRQDRRIIGRLGLEGTDARHRLAGGNSGSSEVYIGFPNLHAWVSKT